MCSHERGVKATFNLTGPDAGQEPIVTEMAFCVCDAQCQGPLQQAEAVYVSDLKAEQSSETELQRIRCSSPDHYTTPRHGETL